VKAKRIINAIKSMGSRLRPAGQTDERKSNSDNLLMIEEARREWLAAREYFDNVSDPNLVEHAIYAYLAAEKRYMFLLSEARCKGLNAPSPTLKKD